MSTSYARGTEKTLPMTVANTGFMLDRLGKDCAQLQYLRELTQNAIEAIQDLPDPKGEVVWDVDWDRYDLTGIFKLCVIDTGVGMTGAEQAKYVNQLSSSVHQQSHEGNFGVGAKIAAATRNHEGLMYLSWKDGTGHMSQLWRDPNTNEYGLRQLALPGGKFGYWAEVEDVVKPKQIGSHGTKVVLLGNDSQEDTMRAPAGVPTATKWIRRYLNTRYFQFPDGITVKVREGWEQPRSDLNLLRQVTGQKVYLEQHATGSGTVQLTNAKAHWWVLQNEPALNGNSGQIASNGHVAALYRDELYEMVQSRTGVARLQLFGIIFGYQRVVIYVEPESGPGIHVSSNTARTHLLLNSEPLPWADWAAEFRQNLPQEIRDLMEEVAGDTQSSDHRESIRDRLRRIRELFRFSRYRATPKGNESIDDAIMTPGGIPAERSESTEATGGKSGGRGGRAGDVYALFIKDQGVPGEAVDSDPLPQVIWVSVKDGTRTSGFLDDRAAKYLVEQNLIQANADFRAFTDMTDRYHRFYDDIPGAREVIEDVVREWFEQALTETVMGIQNLKDSRQWDINQISSAWSEEALTAAVMPRWHIDQAIKRSLGNRLGTMKEKAA